MRISDEVRMSAEKVRRMSEENAPNGEEEQSSVGKLSTSRLAKKLGLKTQELTDHLIHLGAIEISEGRKQITPIRPTAGRRVAGERAVWSLFPLAGSASPNERLTRTDPKEGCFRISPPLRIGYCGPVSSICCNFGPIRCPTYCTDLKSRA
jgi:hypothetical protein